MNILLPPSEGKNYPLHDRTINWSSLAFAKELTPSRIALLETHPEIDYSRCDYASNIYNGVLYRALDYATLTTAAQERANTSIIIISSAFGAVRMSDLIPYYKFKIEPSMWKQPLKAALVGIDAQLTVDCRSSTYSSGWTPNPSNTVGIRVYQRAAGELKVVTHQSKVIRGLVARYLLSQSTVPTDPPGLYNLLTKEFECSLIASVGKLSWFIDVISS